MKLIETVAAALALAVGAPVTAQDKGVVIDVEEVPADAETDAMANFAAKIGELFTAEPLTSEQESRLPLAGEVVAMMTPPGFYADVMGEMMSSTVEPIFGMMSGPLIAESLLTDQVGLADDELPELTEEPNARIVALLDPVAPQRAEAMTSAMTSWMSGMFEQIEDPLREGFTKAFATRFADEQLLDLQTFFATPTGALYAKQAFSIYADPQVMAASMQMMPEMLGSIAGLVSSFETAMANLPPARGYADLSEAERRELATLLNISERELRFSMQAAEKVQAERD